MSERRVPHFGTTSLGHEVHARTADHHPAGTAYQRFNKVCAIWITKNVGSMTAFWVFTVLAAFVAPSCLYAAGYIHWKTFLTTFGFELLATLILSTWLELALMPAIMVGQNLQSAASDARAAKQFEDTEVIADRLDTSTRGGITEVLDAIKALRRDEDAQLTEIHRHVEAETPGAGEFAPPPEVADAQVSAGAGDNPASQGLTADQPSADALGVGAERMVPPAATTRKPRGSKAP